MALVRVLFPQIKLSHPGPDGRPELIDMFPKTPLGAGLGLVSQRQKSDGYKIPALHFPDQVKALLRVQHTLKFHIVDDDDDSKEYGAFYIRQVRSCQPLLRMSYCFVGLASPFNQVLQQRQPADFAHHRMQRIRIIISVKRASCSAILLPLLFISLLP